MRTRTNIFLCLLFLCADVSYLWAQTPCEIVLILRHRLASQGREGNCGPICTINGAHIIYYALTGTTMPYSILRKLESDIRLHTFRGRNFENGTFPWELHRFTEHTLSSLGINARINTEVLGWMPKASLKSNVKSVTSMCLEGMDMDAEKAELLTLNLSPSAGKPHVVLVLETGPLVTERVDGHAVQSRPIRLIDPNWPRYIANATLVRETFDQQDRVKLVLPENSQLTKSSKKYLDSKIITVYAFTKISPIGMRQKAAPVLSNSVVQTLDFLD